MDQNELQKITPNPGSEKEMFNMLVAAALENKHMKFEFIRNWQMRKIVKTYRNGLKKVVKVFKTAKKEAEEVWDDALRSGKIDLMLPLLCAEMKHCYDYYKEELETANIMLTEYREYVLSGHILDTFLFKNWRPDLLCYDHRGWPFNKKKIK